MSRRERGQVSIAAVGVAIAVLLGAVVLVHLAAIRSGGAHAQSAADVAALAGVRVLATDPSAPKSVVESAVTRAAAANGGRVEAFRVETSNGVPTAVDVTVSELVTGAVPGVGKRADRVWSWSRAGVTYTATLASGSFRPVDLAGAQGAAAVVAAAEAQIGWPYVWGGESRAEGGFDCSGLVDYAYGAAGVSLPGRPTAADLWHMSRHVTAAELAPGDLVFLGADTNQPYHVGMYVGGGMTVVAPHTGAEVSYEALVDVPWDGFGRLLAGAPAADPASSAVEAAARRYQVPAYVIAAELRLAVDTNPYRIASLLHQAMLRHGSDLMEALTDQLGGDASRAAVVMRSASGPALGAGFEAKVELLPRPLKQAGGGQPTPPAGGSSWGSLISGVGGTVGHGVDWLGELRHEGGLHVPRHLGHGANVLLDITSAIPNKTTSAIGQVASAGRDIYSAARLVRGPLVEASKFARGLGGVVACLQIGMSAYGLYRARTWRGRLYNGAMLIGGVLILAGSIIGGVAAAPLLVAAGLVITAVATVYINWDTLTSAGSRAAGWCRHAAGSVLSSIW